MDQSTLTIMIEQKRNEMIDVGMQKGFTHSETIKASQELDQLLNKRDQLLNKPTKGGSK